MSRPYIHPHISLHPYNEGDTPPTIVIRSVSLSGLDAISHQVDFVVGGETVASVSLFSYVNAPILVTQIDERDGADDIVEQLAEARS